MMKGQGALEYLIIIAAVLGISAVVVLFVSGAFTGATGGADISKCRLAAANCQKDMALGVSTSCNYCEEACRDSSGKDVLDGVPGCGLACQQCKQGSTISYGYEQTLGLVASWDFDEGSVTTTSDGSGNGNTGTLSGKVIGDFEGSKDGFSDGGCSSGVSGGTVVNDHKIGSNSLRVGGLAGNAFTCAYKSIGRVLTGNSTWFYGKGYVGAQLWDGAGVSYVQDMETGCRTPDANSGVYSVCNGGQPYPDWRLFRLVAYRDSTQPASVYIYNAGGVGDGYYDFITNGPTWVERGSGWATSFDGYDDYIGIASGGISVGVNHTFAAWIKRYAPPFNGVGTIFNMRGQSNTQGFYFVYVSADGNYLVYQYSDGIAYRVLSWSFAFGTSWHHIAFTKDGETVTAFIDGAPQTPKIATGILDVPPSTSYIGNYQGGGMPRTHFFNGMIDRIKIYNRVVSNEQIREWATP